MAKLMNLLRRNPRMTAGGIVLVIILVAVVVWMVNGGLKRKEVRGEPEITFTTGKKVLNPDQAGTVSTYVEYSGSKTAEYIDINVNWINGAGFSSNKVTGLKFDRVRRTTTTAGDTDTVLDTVYDTEYLIDFEDGNITFSGSNVATKSVSEVLGDNRVIVYYTKDTIPTGVTPDLSTLTWESTPLATTASIPITATDIDTTYDISSSSEISIDLKISGDAFTGVKTDGQITKYKITAKDGTDVQTVRISANTKGGVTFMDDSNASYNFGITTTSPITFTFEDYIEFKLIGYTDGNTQKYLRKDGNTLSFHNKDDIFIDQATLNKSLFTLYEIPSRDGELTGQKLLGHGTTGLTATNATEQILLFWRPDSDAGKNGQTNPYNTAHFLKDNAAHFAAHSVILETVDPDNNVYRLKSVSGNFYFTYAGDRKLKTATVRPINDETYNVTFEKYSDSEPLLYKASIMLNDVRTYFWLGIGWYVDGSDVDATGVDGVTKTFVLFNAIGGLSGNWKNNDLTYYSCADDKVIGCNALINNTGIGDMTSLACEETSEMYCY